MRIGTGYDVHRLQEGLPLVIGGVHIPHHQGLVAHSDGDVLLHAICDALLGAAGLGDIGQHFPDSDERFRNISSRVLLRSTMALLAERGLRLASLDCTLILEQPRMAPYRQQMTRNLAEDTGLAMNRINVKATTTEGLGFTGREEGIAAQAVCLLDEPEL